MTHSNTFWYKFQNKLKLTYQTTTWKLWKTAWLEAFNVPSFNDSDIHVCSTWFLSILKPIISNCPLHWDTSSSFKNWKYPLSTLLRRHLKYHKQRETYKHEANEIGNSLISGQFYHAFCDCLWKFQMICTSVGCPEVVSCPLINYLLSLCTE